MNLRSAFLFVFILGFVNCEEKEATEGGVRVKVVGKSGKIKVADAAYDNVDDDPDRIMISFDSITELDANREMVGNTGNTKHSFNSFASQDFDFTNLIHATFQELGVQTFNFTCTLDGLTSKIKVAMYIFKEDGNITVFGDNMHVRQSQIKFNIELSDWEFCGHDDTGCKKGQQEQFGEYVDFDIEVKSKGNANKNDGDSKQNDDDLDEYDLGSGFFRVSSKYEWDDDASEIQRGDMPDSYPLVTTKSNKQIFTFRFGRFKTYAHYDPIIQYSGVAKMAMSLAMLLIVTTGYFLK